MVTGCDDVVELDVDVVDDTWLELDVVELGVVELDVVAGRLDDVDVADVVVGAWVLLVDVVEEI